MQDNIAEKGPHQVLAPPGVQQRHIQNHNVNLFLFCENPPLILDFFIVASQPVDALDIEQVVRLEFSDPPKAKDNADTSLVVVIEEFQKKVQSVIEEEGSPGERIAKIYLAMCGIDGDNLTPEEFKVLVGILEKSSLKENSISQRGKKRPAPQRKREK